MTWRTGRKNGRTIYEQRNTEPSDDDKPIGMMDTAALAAHVVEVVNAWDATDEPGKYEARCECGHPSKEHHYKNGCERITREVGGWRNCVCMNDSRGRDYRDVQAAEYTDGPPLLCPECGHSQNAHVQLEELGCTKPIFAAPGDWHSDCPCKLTYDEITARLAGPDAQPCGSCGHHTTAHVPAAAPSQVGCLADVLDEYEQKAYCPCVLNQEEAEMTARLAAHGLAEDEPMPASCLLGRCGHKDADTMADPSTWFTREELAGIADDGANRMERGPVRKSQGLCACIGRKGCYCDPEYVPPAERLIGAGKPDLPDEAPKIAEVAARPQRWSAHEEAGLEPKEWVAAIDPAAPENVVVVELARGGIVKDVPHILSSDWTPPARMGSFTVPQGIRDLFRPSMPNVKVTVTGPSGEKLGEVINPALTEGEKGERQAALDRLAEDMGIDPELAAQADGHGHYSTIAERQNDPLTRIAELVMEGVLDDVNEFAHKALLDAGIDPTGITVAYDMSPLRPRPIVDVELPDVTEYRDPDAHVAPDSSDLICNKCGAVVFTEDDGWACDCDSAMFEHARPEVDGDDDK